jgi:hypothetical protein
MKRWARWDHLSLEGSGGSIVLTVIERKYGRIVEIDHLLNVHRLVSYCG